MGAGASSKMESQYSEQQQKFDISDHQDPQNPQSEELGFIESQSMGSGTTLFSSSDHSFAVKDDGLKQNHQHQQQYAVDVDEEGILRKTLDEESHQVIYVDEQGILRTTLDEESHQVIYKEGLNEAVMNLALGEEGNAARGDEERGDFNYNRALKGGEEGDANGVEWARENKNEEMGFGRGMNGEVWGGSDINRGYSENVGQNQGQIRNDEFGSTNGKEEKEDGGEENYGTEEASGYGGGRSYNKRFQYPVRLDADNPHYMKTGRREFVRNCKFNHPPNRRNQGARDKVKPREQDSERLGKTECKGARDKVKPREQDSERLGKTDCKGAKDKVTPGEQDSERLGKTECKGARDKVKPREQDSERLGKTECKGARDKVKPREQDSERLGKTECKGARDKVKPREQDSERLGKTECKGARDKVKPREQHSERLGKTQCMYYQTSGRCKFGSACKYNHSRERSSVAPIMEFNFLGLPIRPGEKECPYLMRTGFCKYGSNCQFNHPDPTSVAGNDPSSGYGNGGSPQIHGSAQPTASSWSSGSMMFPPTQGIPLNPEWNGCQATVHPTSERSLPTPTAVAMNNPATETNFYATHQQQMPVDEYPQQPGRPDCSSFLKTGDCKYKTNCRFRHQKFQSSKLTSCALRDKGLLPRPDKTICSSYNRYGICKFGPACKFDHPENRGESVSSDGVGMSRT